MILGEPNKIFVGGTKIVNELEVTKYLIRILAFFAIFRDWDTDKLLKVYEYLEIPLNLVNDTLCEET